MSDYYPYVNYIASLALPKCAMSFGGVYLETVVPGYRTLYASGRDSLESEDNELEGTVTDGSTYRSRHIRTRDITVGYALVADNVENYHKAFDKLKGVLYAAGTENVKVIFRDEDDVFYEGHVTALSADKFADIRSGGGSITIHCPKPWKYSVEEKEVTPTNGVITLDYPGTYPSFPTFEVTAKGNLGYVSFAKTKTADGAILSSKVIQIGDPEEKGSATVESTSLIKDYFQTSRPSGWSDNTALVPPSPRNNHEHKGQLLINGAGIGCYEHPSYYSTGTQWHGPSITKTFSETARNFQCYFFMLITTSAIAQVSNFVVSIESGSGNSRSNLCAMWFVKDSGAVNSGRVELVIKNKIVKTISIPSFAYNNSITGYPKGATWYDVAHVPEANRSKNSAGGKFYITKLGSKIQFTVAGTIHEFTDDTIADVEGSEVSAWFETWGTSSPTAVVVLRELSVDKYAGEYAPTTVVSNVINKFQNGDSIIAEVGSGRITVNGTEKYGLGAMGNDWEEFTLDPGANAISCNYSEWASPPPDFKMKYREVYL